MPKAKQHLTVDGRNVPISNLDKVLFPDGNVTKAQIIQYYLRVSEYLLPHLCDRPVTLKRYPNGVLGNFFYEKDAPRFTPEWVKTYLVPRREREGTIRYILINDRPTLAWVANIASLEIHPFLYRVPNIDKPTTIVFDLDPGEGADILTCSHVALLLRELLGKFDLQCFPKVSGSKGLQVYVPLNTKVTYDITQPLAKAVGELLARQNPKLIVAEMKKSLRAKKVFIDWSQNSDFKSTVAVYSLRAKKTRPFVSIPVHWDELERALKKKATAALYFDMDVAPPRIEKTGDLFKPVLTMKQKLPASVLKHLK